MELNSPRGRLLAIGGKEDREKDCVILKEFMRLAGGKSARIVTMTVATDAGLKIGEEYIQLFKQLGAGKVQNVDVVTREDTHDPHSLRALEDATGLFFTGGDQLDVTSLLGGTEMDRVIRKKYESGTILAGTSAGAAMMSHAMIISGESESNPRLSDIKIAPGEELLLGAIIDTHFSQRGRHGRLLSAVAQYPHDIGIGIDEDTGIIIQGDELQVIGSGAVTVIDVGATSYTNVPEIKDGESLSLFDVRFHVLPSGFRYDLLNRKPFLSEQSIQNEKDKRRKAQKKTPSKLSKASKTKAKRSR